VVGEQTNLVVAYLATVSRKAERPFGVVVQSSSAAGKSTLADAVAALVPEEDLVSLSALTAQSLYYLGAGDLARKVLFVSEEHGASRAAYALKLLISEGRLAIASAGKDPETGRLRTRSYGVEGPVSLLMTTTAAEVDAELANRLVVLGVDEDRAQTRAVQAAQRRAATLQGLMARLGREPVIRLHRNAQRLLEPLPVVVPGAEELAFPDSSTRHRRDHQKLLSVIAAITLCASPVPASPGDGGGGRHPRALRGGERRGCRARGTAVPRGARTGCRRAVTAGPEASFGHGEPGEPTPWQPAGKFHPQGAARTDRLVRAPGPGRPGPFGGSGVRF